MCGWGGARQACVYCQWFALHLLCTQVKPSPTSQHPHAHSTSYNRLQLTTSCCNQTAPGSAGAVLPQSPPAALMPPRVRWQTGRRPCSCLPNRCAGPGLAAPHAAHTCVGTAVAKGQRQNNMGFSLRAATCPLLRLLQRTPQTVKPEFVFEPQANAQKMTHPKMGLSIWSHSHTSSRPSAPSVNSR